MADPGMEPGRAGSHPPASTTRTTRGSPQTTHLEPQTGAYSGLWAFHLTKVS